MSLFCHSLPATCLLGLGVLGLVPRPASAQLVRYEFPGGVFTPTVTSGAVTASSINGAGSQADVNPTGGSFASVFLGVNPIGRPVAATAADAVALDRFLQFTVAPVGGFPMNLSRLTFDAANGGPSTPRGWVLRSSVDGFATTLATQNVTTVNPDLSSFTVPLDAAPFQSLAAATTFRLYGFTPSGGAGIVFDNITLNGTAGEQVLAGYEFPGSAFTPTVTAARVTASSVNGSGSQADVIPGGGSFGSVFLGVNPLGKTVADTAAEGVALDRFLQFSVTPESGYALNLSRLTFDASSGGPSTPRGWVLRSSVDGFASDLSSALTTTVGPDLSGFDVALGGPEFKGLLGTTTFRLYGFTPSSGAGIVFDNIRVRGAAVATSAPEPGALALIALAGLPAVGAAFVCGARSKRPGGSW